MHTPFLSHDLPKEFPNLAELVQRLRTSDAHFARTLDDYNTVDHEILKAEEEVTPLDDVTLENLKKQRLRLKDELYRMLTAQQA